MSALYFKGKKFDNIPGTWNDLKPNQLITIAGLLHANIHPNEAVFKIIMCLLEIRKHWWLAWNLLLKTSHEDKIDFMADTRLLADFILTPESYSLTRNLIPVITIPRTIRKSERLYGPPDSCKKMVFMEFIKAETYYLAYRKNYTNVPLRMQSLNRLIAVLYRHKQIISNTSTWNGDVREVYNDNTVIYRAEKIIAQIPDNIKYAILIFYISCRAIKVERYNHVFSGETGSGGGNWIDALRSMAGGALNMEKISMVDADVALYDLNKSIEESKRK
ncbi:hypothetical protein [Marinoscillum furvescens]|uniref:Uncharacterized protein n=1 Tax=Marinoscillum furvescens DSM 4134 TaxID=1122208 RepID=A0A3D9L5B6_MARFU|nr:hypothetical protein [Marinoscillum furvescens]REE01109.1 hypothetical protein C7460_104129 [Marinoscillum furvescens DSM 4134]